MTIEEDDYVPAPPKKAPIKGNAYLNWLLWIFGVIVLGPILWVAIYSFINPPVTLRMVLAASKPVERKWEALSHLSPNLVDAAIAAEDSNFCTNNGFDIAAVRAAWKHTDTDNKMLEASTISMRTAQNAFLWPEHNWIGKVLGAYFTVLLEHLWPKHRIMEVYLNTAQWGDSLYGAESAAQFYFHKPAFGLTSNEAARLAAVLSDTSSWAAVDDTPAVVYRVSLVEQRAAIVHADGLSDCLH